MSGVDADYLSVPSASTPAYFINAPSQEYTQGASLASSEARLASQRRRKFGIRKSNT